MKQLVLAGAGHAHAQILLAWAAAPLPGVQVTLVAPQALAPYSGMVPGWLAGIYRYDEIVIDFDALCAAAGARWIAAELAALEPDQRGLRLSNGTALHYDVLSLNVGSTVRPPDVGELTLLPLRPLAQLRRRYDTFLNDWIAERNTTAITVTAVGGGAAGFESLLAVLHRLRQLRPDCTVHGRLVSRSTMVLPGLSAAAQRAALRALAAAGVTVELGRDWTAPTHPGQAGDERILWATGALAHDWQLDAQRRGSLAVNADGFIRVDAQLRSVSHAQIFAVGDCAHWDAGPQALPKAGVYAVRMGPPLLRNLRAALGQGTAGPYAPQRHVLALLATADGRAIATRGALGASGRWAWHLKNVIDRRFVRRFVRRFDTHPATDS